ncbi:hypothetical protein HFD88_000937 [Aspergillus terreus]|nr:hypothetical protein HFD88_000937 [Aspergillus terreus]
MASLTSEIGRITDRADDSTIVSVLMVLFADARQSPSIDWRHHFAGAMQLIKLRGGLETLFHSTEYMRPALLYLMVLLEDIERFSPQDWSDSAPNNQEDWLVLGSVYQSAALIYCIASLQSLSVLPSTSELNATRAAHGHSLLTLLRKALLLPQMRNCMLWPLVVAGMETGRAAAPSRQFVSHELRIMTQDLGTPIASSANAILQRFWSSGKDTWDDCFDRPCAFVT